MGPREAIRQRFHACAVPARESLSSIGVPNLAYHPYCVYAESYSCPLTPAENRLPIRIEAGERLAEEASASTE